MIRRRMLLLIAVVALLVVHDATLAVGSHAESAPSGQAHHDLAGEGTSGSAPGDCGVVRVTARGSGHPDPAPSEPEIQVLPVDSLLATSSIHLDRVSVPLIPPPVACRAHFRVYRL